MNVSNCVKFFVEEPSFVLAMPLFPYLVKALKVLPQMLIENKISTARDCQSFLDAFQVRAYKSLSEKENPSPEVMRRAQELLASRIELLIKNKYKDLKSLGIALESTFVELLDEVASPNLIKIIDLNFMLSSNDLKALDIDETNYYSRLAKGSLVHRCAEYAFYILKEPRIMPWIKGERVDSPFFTLEKKEVIGLLNDWNYEIVTDPIAGDLILYINNLSNKFTHAGIFESPDRVISKFGMLPVFSHRIGQISNAYHSNSYLCFRKDGGDGVHSPMKKFLQTVKERGALFDYEATHSPLTDRGSLLVIQNDLIKIALASEKVALDTPPYGKSYFQTVARRISEFIQTDFIPFNFSRNTLDIIQKVEDGVDQIIRTTDPMV